MPLLPSAAGALFTAGSGVVAPRIASQSASSVGALDFALNHSRVGSLGSITARFVAFTGDENARLRSRLRKPGSRAMQRHYKHAKPLDLRLTDESQRLRKEARGTPPGIERERLLRKARQSETAAQMQE